MKKKLFMLIIVLLSIFIVQPVFAKEVTQKCYYEFYSPQYGSSYVILLMHEDTPPTGILSTFNSKEISGFSITIEGDKGNVEHVNGWSRTDYNNHNQVCPYYAEVETSSVYGITISYDKNELNKLSDSRLDSSETHVLVSTTIEKDKAKNGETYDKSTDSIEGTEIEKKMTEFDKVKEISRTCAYVLDKKDRDKGVGYTEVDLILGKDKNGKDIAVAGVHMVNGKSTTIIENKQFTHIKDPDNILASSIQNKTCPYYLTYDNILFNGVSVSNIKSGQTNTYGPANSINAELVLTTIADEKSDYDAEKDGTPVSFSTESALAHARSVELGYESPSDPGHGGEGGYENPFGMREGTVGDHFCTQPETIRATRIMGYFALVVRVFVPFLIIIWGILDFTKVVTSGNTDDLKKQGKKLGFRLLIGLFIFFLPVLIDIVVTSFIYFSPVEDEYNKCTKCIFHPLDDESCTATSVQQTVSDDTQTSLKGAFTSNVDENNLKPGVIINEPKNE